MFDAVLFDMDGLLLDSERVYFETYFKVAGRHDVTVSKDGFIELVGLTRPDLLRVLTRQLGEADLAEAFFEDWRIMANDQIHGAPVIKPGVLDLLDQIPDLPKAVVTSSRSDHARDVLTTAGLLPRFDALIGGDMVPKPKPHPTPYLMGAEALGVDITRCAAFEDSATGIRAAVASGARAVQVPDLVPVDDATRALGHVIARDLISGAQMIGLISGGASDA